MPTNRIRRAATWFPFPLLTAIAATLAMAGQVASGTIRAEQRTMTGHAVPDQKKCQRPDHNTRQNRPSVDTLLHRKLSKTLERRVDVPLERFAHWFYNAPLERQLKGTEELPGVVATKPMTKLPFPQVGARRLVCLSDGSSAIEEVVHNDPGRSFAYIVWGYTAPQGQAVEYGYGQFWFQPEGRSTRVRWSYSFKLKEDKFPGCLGAAGRALFRATFLDSTYERFMRSSLETIAQEARASAL